MAESQTPAGWEIQKRPPGMTRRYEFESYAETRQFLDELADLSERTGYHPNLNFNRTQVTVTIQAGADEPGQTEYDFAAGADAILSQQAA